jgi:hypothetical protein
MKRIVLLLSGFALALSVGVARPARAGSPPTAAIQGTWAFVSTTGVEGYTVGVGNLTFDGKGGVTGVLNYNYDSEYCVGMALSGSYTVNPGKLSGSASMSVASVNTNTCSLTGDGDTLTLAFYLGSNLKTLNYVEIDPDSAGYLVNDFGAALTGPATHF